MYRVRKLNRKTALTSSGGGIRRPRLSEFQMAYDAVVTGERGSATPYATELERMNAYLNAPRGYKARITDFKRNEAGLILVPISDQSRVPSLAEVVRVATGHGLAGILEHRNMYPCGVGVWPGIPASFDNGARCVLDRNGDAFPTANLQIDSPDEVEKLLGPLPHTEFTEPLLYNLRECWDEDPLVMKLRIMMYVFASWQTLVVASDGMPRKLHGMKQSGKRPRLTYRAHLARMLEEFPVVSVVSPLEGSSLTVDSSAASALGGRFVHFPSVSATLVEGKVERWLDKYDLKPEQMLSKTQPSELVSSVFPADPIGDMKAAREKMLSKFFRLEENLEELGFSGSAKQIDKIASKVDTQFDQITAQVKTQSRLELETAMNQLSKARSYLRPLGRPQGPGMSILHYMNFYGTMFGYTLSNSLEISDGRHHMVYLGA